MGSEVSPARIDSIIASTSSAVGNSFSVGDGTCPVCTFTIIGPNCIGDNPEGVTLSDALPLNIISWGVTYGCPGTCDEPGNLAPVFTASRTAAAAAAAGPPTPAPVLEKIEPPALADGKLLLVAPDPDIWFPPIPNGEASFPGG